MKSNYLCKIYNYEENILSNFNKSTCHFPMKQWPKLWGRDSFGAVSWLPVFPLPSVLLFLLSGSIEEETEDGKVE